MPTQADQLAYDLLKKGLSPRVVRRKLRKKGFKISKRRIREIMVKLDEDDAEAAHGIYLFGSQDQATEAAGVIREMKEITGSSNSAGAVAAVKPYVPIIEKLHLLRQKSSKVSNDTLSQISKMVDDLLESVDIAISRAAKEAIKSEEEEGEE
jgi:hypothetical protein